MMYLTDRGTAYSDGFYEVKDNRVVNPFTGKSLGIVVRIIASNNYLLDKKPNWWQRIISWFSEQQEIQDRRAMDYSKAKPGSLKETMKGLE